jgi:ribosomal protein L36
MSTLKVYDKQNHIIRRKGIYVVLINKWFQPVMLNKNTALLPRSDPKKGGGGASA